MSIFSSVSLFPSCNYPSQQMLHRLSLFQLTKVVCVDEDLTGKYVVVCYDGLLFPGIILDVDQEYLEVKVQLLLIISIIIIVYNMKCLYEVLMYFKSEQILFPLLSIMKKKIFFFQLLM